MHTHTKLKEKKKKHSWNSRDNQHQNPDIFFPLFPCVKNIPLLSVIARYFFLNADLSFYQNGNAIKKKL